MTQDLHKLTLCQGTVLRVAILLGVYDSLKRAAPLHPWCIQAGTVCVGGCILHSRTHEGSAPLQGEWARVQMLAQESNVNEGRGSGRGSVGKGARGEGLGGHHEFMKCTLDTLYNPAFAGQAINS